MTKLLKVALNAYTRCNSGKTRGVVSVASFIDHSYRQNRQNNQLAHKSFCSKTWRLRPSGPVDPGSITVVNRGNERGERRGILISIREYACHEGRRVSLYDAHSYLHNSCSVANSRATNSPPLTQNFGKF